MRGGMSTLCLCFLSPLQPLKKKHPAEELKRRLFSKGKLPVVPGGEGGAAREGEGE